MTSLYNITTEIKQRLDEVLENDWLPQTTLDTLLPAIKAEAFEKQVAVAAYILNLESDIRQIKELIEAKQSIVKSAENRTERLRSILLWSMESLKISEVKCGAEFTIKLKENPEKVEINNEALIPDEYMRIIPATKEPDKNKIKEQLKKVLVDDKGAPIKDKNGNVVRESVAGCHLVRGKKLEIK